MISSRRVSEWFAVTVGLSLVVTVAFLSHQILIAPLESLVAPLESKFVGYEIVGIVSLIFIPHGIKVLVVAISGYVAILPIMLSQFIGGIFYQLSVLDALIAAAIGTAAVMLPYVLIRMNGFDFRQAYQSSLFWVMMTIGISSSVLNGTFISLYRNYNIFDGLAFRFFVGDVVGTLVVFLGLLVFRKTLIKFAYGRIRQSLE